MNGPKNGYEIKQSAKNSSDLFWTELKFGHIYPALQSLLKQNFITVHEKSSPEQGKPSTSYKITKKGIAHLDAWIKDRNTINSTKSETLAKLFFSSKEHIPLQMERVKELYEIMKKNMEILIKQKEPLENLVEKGESSDPSKVFKLITLEFGLNYFKGMKELTEKSLMWLKKLERE